MSISTNAVWRGVLLSALSLFLIPIFAEAKESAKPVTVAGITFKPLWGWKTQAPASAMRKAQWEVPGTTKEQGPAEVVVFYFGRNQGGNVPQNLDRWRSRMKTDTGERMVGEVTEREVDAVPITEIQLYGTYASGMPMRGVPPVPRPDYGLVGAIIEGPQGNVFIRLTGPEATVKARLEDFRKFTDSFGKPKTGKKKKK